MVERMKEQKLFEMEKFAVNKMKSIQYRVNASKHNQPLAFSINYHLPAGIQRTRIKCLSVHNEGYGFIANYLGLINIMDFYIYLKDIISTIT